MSAGAAAAAAAAVAQAIKASGVLVRMEPNEFREFLKRQTSPLIVHSMSRFFSVRYHYLTSYKGLAFYTSSPNPLPLPADAELIQARGMFIPG